MIDSSTSIVGRIKMNDDKPKVAIILVNYNGAYDTIECINSIQNSTYRNYKIIVVDNGSNDQSVSQIRAVVNTDQVLIIESKENLGFSEGNNIGIKFALENGFDYSLLLNNDTLVKPDFLTRIVNAAILHNDSAIVTGKIYYATNNNILWYAGGSINRKTSRTVHYGIHEEDNGKYDKEKEVTFISGCCMLVPTKIIQKIGGMARDYFLYSEDTDYCCRAIEAGFRLIYQPQAILYHKVSSSTSRLSELMNYYVVRNKLIIISKYICKKYKPISYSYVTLECVKRIITKEYSISAVKKAYRDFRTGISGKVNTL